MANQAAKAPRGARKQDRQAGARQGSSQQTADGTLAGAPDATFGTITAQAIVLPYPDGRPAIKLEISALGVPQINVYGAGAQAIMRCSLQPAELVFAFGRDVKPRQVARVGTQVGDDGAYAYGVADLLCTSGPQGDGARLYSGGMEVTDEDRGVVFVGIQTRPEVSMHGPHDPNAAEVRLAISPLDPDEPLGAMAPELTLATMDPATGDHDASHLSTTGLVVRSETRGEAVIGIDGLPHVTLSGPVPPGRSMLARARASLGLKATEPGSCGPCSGTSSAPGHCGGAPYTTLGAPYIALEPHR